MNNTYIRPLRHQWLLPLRYLRHRLIPRATYAADREDVAVQCLLSSVERFIDVGANDGFACSNSFLFAVNGTRGICFEPEPSNFARLSSLLRFKRRVRCISQGLSDREWTVQMSSDGLLSSIDSTDDPGLADLLDEHRTSDAALVEASVSCLAKWLEQFFEFVGRDFISIDVEGHELHVLEGIDWQCTPKPARCLAIETHAVGVEKSWRHRDFDQIQALLDARGYVRVAASANNTFWLHREDVDDVRLREARRRLPGYIWEPT